MHSMLRVSRRPIFGLTLSAVAMAVVAPAAWSQSQRGLTPVRIAQIESVTSTVISPDGRYVAYLLSVPADPFQENQTAAAHLYVLDRTTGATTPLHTTSTVSTIAFRPGRGTITFITAIANGEPRSVYELPVTGGTPAKVWGFEEPVSAYSWSPDGNRLAVMANERVTPPTTPLPYQPTFFEENLPQRRGYVVDVAGGGTVRQIPHDGSYYFMAWSPAGDRLAVSVAPTPRVDDSYMAQSVSVIDAGTLNVAARIDNRGKIGGIAWSPDGRFLALRAGNDIHDPIEGRIMVVPASGGTPRNILPDFEGQFEAIAWTGNGEIHFIASEGVASTFGRIRPDGSGFQRIVAQDGLILTAFDRATAGVVALAGNTPRHPSELFVLEAGNAAPVRITDSNPWLADVALGEQRIVRYTPRDRAFELEGLLILPVDYRQGTRVPLINVVHGGPEAHFSNGWLTTYSNPGQLGAARGYAVFYPNYRGSTGRGLAFAMSSQADGAGREFDDVVDGVDYLIAQGIADRDRVGVTGGSYGGFATAWLSTYYSDRFAAGVMFVGISNRLSKWGTSDIPEEMYLVHTRERVWDHWQKFLERSPIYYVDRARTPLLIMHGAQDTRVHPGQSLELYRHLVVRHPDLPVRFILYPGEGHGNARSASRLDYTERMMGWFDAFLAGDGRKPGLDVQIPAPTVNAGSGSGAR